MTFGLVFILSVFLVQPQSLLFRFSDATVVIVATFHVDVRPPLDFHGQIR